MFGFGVWGLRFEGMEFWEFEPWAMRLGNCGFEVWDLGFEV